MPCVFLGHTRPRVFFRPSICYKLYFEMETLVKITIDREAIQIDQVGQVCVGFINAHLLYLPSTLDQSEVDQFFDPSTLINRHFDQSVYYHKNLRTRPSFIPSIKQ